MEEKAILVASESTDEDILLLSKYIDIAYYKTQIAKLPTDPLIEESVLALKNSKSEKEVVHHYLSIGTYENIDPVAWFSTAEYKATNPDVVGSGINPFLHFLKYGIDENRKPLANLSSELYQTLDDLIKLDSEQIAEVRNCLLYTSPSPRDKRQSRMPSSA